MLIDDLKPHGIGTSIKMDESCDIQVLRVSFFVGFLSDNQFSKIYIAGCKSISGMISVWEKKI